MLFVILLAIKCFNQHRFKIVSKDSLIETRMLKKYEMLYETKKKQLSIIKRTSTQVLRSLINDRIKCVIKFVFCHSTSSEPLNARFYFKHIN